MNTRLHWLAVPLMAVLLCGGADLAQAKKPVKPPPPPPTPTDTGLIYFQNGVDDVEIHTVLPDGSGLDDGDAPFSALGLPWQSPTSLYSHDGERWFLGLGEILGASDPDGRPRYEVFAVSESGTRVQVTDATDVQPNSQNEEFFRARLCWAVDDTRISYVGRRWQDGVVVEGGIYYVDLPCDIAELATPLQTPTCIPCPLTDVDHDLRPDLFPRVVASERGVDWSPDGDAVVYALAEGGLFEVDLTTGVVSNLPTGGNRVVCVDWSPDGLSILYEENAEIFSVDLVYQSRVLLIACDSKGCPEQPSYSPSGTHIVFRKRISHPNPAKSRAELRIATAEGADVTTILDSAGNYPTWVVE